MANMSVVTPSVTKTPPSSTANIDRQKENVVKFIVYNIFPAYVLLFIGLLFIIIIIYNSY